MKFKYSASICLVIGERGGFRGLNRKLCVFVLMVGLFVASWFFGGATRSASVEQDDSSAMLDGNGLDVYFFYGTGCSHCAEVEPFLAKMEQEYSLRLHKFDVYSNRSYLSLFDEYCNMYGLPLERSGVPTVFVSDTYFVGDSPILDGFEEMIEKALEEYSSVDAALELESQGWKEHVGELRLIVARPFQRKGLGTLMARELYLLAAREKVEEIVVKMMRPQSAAYSIFKKIGFVEDATLSEYVKDRSGSKQDLIVMRCDLRSLMKEMENYLAESDWQRTR